MVITYGNSLERSVCLNNPSTTLLNSARWNYVNRKQIVFFFYLHETIGVSSIEFHVQWN